MSDSGLRRCAIYTRKSSEEGLEQSFNSLDAQREACEAYIVSQKHEGWTALPDAYNDGGFSGGNTDRPALQRLMADVRTAQLRWRVPKSIVRERRLDLALVCSSTEDFGSAQWSTALHRAGGRR